MNRPNRAARRAAARQAREASKRQQAPAAAPERDTNAILERGFRAIQAYVERVPSLPDDLAGHVLLAFETDVPGATKVMLLPREFAIASAIMDKRADLAVELVDPPSTGLTIVATTRAGAYQVRVAEIVTSAADRPITSPGGLA